MPVIDCLVGESLQFGTDIRFNLTGRDGDTLHAFIDAASRHDLGGVGGFHACAPVGIRRRAHVVALGDGDSFSIGPVEITVEAVCLCIPGVRALRELRLRIDLSPMLAIERHASLRRRRRLHRLVG